MKDKKLTHFFRDFKQPSFRILNNVICYSWLYVVVLCNIYILTAVGQQENLVRSIFVRGNQSFTQKQILEIMQTKSGEPYDVEMLRKDTEKITTFLHNKGLVFAKVSVNPIEIENEDGVFIRIVIDEGLIGEITLSGNTKTKDNIILRDLLFQEGDVYVDADRKESERIISQKSYIGAAKLLGPLRFRRIVCQTLGGYV